MRDKPVKTASSRTVAATCAAVVLMLASMLESPPQAVGETELAYDHHSEDEHRMFRGFYYDSWSTIFDLLAGAGMPDSLEAFEQTDASLQIDLCTAIVDYAIFRSTVVVALFRPEFNRRATSLLTMRIMFDLSGVEWSPLDDVNPEDQPAVLRASDNLKQVLKQHGEWLTGRHKFCTNNHAGAMGLHSAHELVPNYGPVPLEFRLRNFYQSQAPFLGWVVAHLRENESQLSPQNFQELEELEALIASIERKYDLSM